MSRTCLEARASRRVGKVAVVLLAVVSRRQHCVIELRAKELARPLSQQGLVEGDPLRDPQLDERRRWVGHVRDHEAPEDACRKTTHLIGASGAVPRTLHQHRHCVRIAERWRQLCVRLARVEGDDTERDTPCLAVAVPRLDERHVEHLLGREVGSDGEQQPRRGEANLADCVVHAGAHRGVHHRPRERGEGLPPATLLLRVLLALGSRRRRGLLLPLRPSTRLCRGGRPTCPGQRARSAARQRTRVSRLARAKPRSACCSPPRAELPRCSRSS
mmetsp:Transcript_42958/g.135581  ORF Transcript_42958/g.135581 Transcript_42958/m.135581 type:complete len:273 (+) Transcript_42958:263-1081(+)